MEFFPQELQESHMGSAPIALSSGIILDWHMEFAIFSPCCSIEVFELDPEYAYSPARAGRYQTLLISTIVSHSCQCLECRDLHIYTMG